MLSCFPPKRIGKKSTLLFALERKPVYCLLLHIDIRIVKITARSSPLHCETSILCNRTVQYMYGVLLYTASGDSEGSLGGLVRQGIPGRIEDTIVAALQSAKWCSSDPICIQSPGQGPDS